VTLDTLYVIFTGLMTEPTVSEHRRRVVSHPDDLNITRNTSPCYNKAT